MGKTFKLDFEHPDSIKPLYEDIQNTFEIKEREYNSPLFTEKLLTSTLKLANDSNNSPIKIKKYNDVYKSYIQKIHAVESTQLLILDGNKNKPFLDDILKYWNIEYFHYYYYFVMMLHEIYITETTREISFGDFGKQKTKIINQNNYPKEFTKIDEIIIKGSFSRCEMSYLLDPHLLKNIPSKHLNNINGGFYFL